MKRQKHKSYLWTEQVNVNKVYMIVCDIVMMHTEGASFLEIITGSPSEGEKAHRECYPNPCKPGTRQGSSCYWRMVRPRPGYSQSWRPDSNMADAGVQTAVQRGTTKMTNVCVINALVPLEKKSSAQFIRLYTRSVNPMHTGQQANKLL